MWLAQATAAETFELGGTQKQSQAANVTEVEYGLPTCAGLVANDTHGRLNC